MDEGGREGATEVQGELSQLRVLSLRVLMRLVDIPMAMDEKTCVAPLDRKMDNGLLVLKVLRGHKEGMGLVRQRKG